MSRIRFKHVALAVACCSAPAGVASAGAVQFQLGEQDFADGTTPVLSAQIRAAGAGEQFPFDGSIFGNDLLPSAGAFEYAHGLDLRGARPLSATLTIGLIDIDSPANAPLDTVALTLDGVEQPAGPGAIDPPPLHNAGDDGGDGDGDGDAEPNPPAGVPVRAALLPAGLLLAGLFAVPKRLLRRWLGM